MRIKTRAQSQTRCDVINLLTVLFSDKVQLCARYTTASLRSIINTGRGAKLCHSPTFRCYEVRGSLICENFGRILNIFEQHLGTPTCNLNLDTSKDTFFDAPLATIGLVAQHTCCKMLMPAPKFQPIMLCYLKTILGP